MAKWFGSIGYSETVETRPGVWEERVSERPYYGDMLRNVRRRDKADQLNDELSISNELSIISDPYAMENFHAVRYATYMGARWKVSSVEVQHPRLILTLGGVYNGPTH